MDTKIKLTRHALKRLQERKHKRYNIYDLIHTNNSEWYKKEDLIHDCALYRHSCYTTRKSPQMAYLTDGDIEVIYNNETGTVITILEVKDKFKPITQFIRPQ